MTHHIHRVAVLGAGTMGAAVAAHAANAGLLLGPPGVLRQNAPAMISSTKESWPQSLHYTPRKEIQA